MFDRAEKRILTWSSDSTARVWNVISDAWTPLEMKHQDAVNGALFNHNQSHILSWSDDGSARLWDAASGEQVGVTMQDQAKIIQAVFDATEEHILTYSKDFGHIGIHTWSATTGEYDNTILQLEGFNEKDVILENSGRRILAWSDEGPGFIGIWLLDGKTGEQIGDPKIIDSFVKMAAFDPKGNYIVTLDGRATVQLWDAANLETHSDLNHPTDVIFAVFDRAGERLLTWCDDLTIRVWEVESGKLIGSSADMGGNDPSVTGVGAMFDGAGKRILTWIRKGPLPVSGDVMLWNTKGEQISATMHHDDQVYGAAFDPTGNRVLSWGGTYFPMGAMEGAGKAWLWDGSTGKQLGAVMPHANVVPGAVFNGAGILVLTWSADGTVRLWRAASGEQIGIPMLHNGPVYGALFDESEKRILTWSQDGSVRLWDVPGDLDCPSELYTLQVQTLTGTYLDFKTREVKVLPVAVWKKIRERYLKMAEIHAAQCEFPRQNVYLKVFNHD
jgi:WD40 repeat protein